MENKAVKNDFSKGSIPKTILRMSVPIILAELVHVLYNLVDRMYIGHIPGEGTPALTGLGICLPLITFIGAFANLCGTGGAPLCSISRGAGETEEACRIQENAFTLLLCLAGVLTVTLFLFIDPLLILMGATEETLPYAKDYFSIYLIGTVFTMISLGMNRFINMQGFAKVGMGTVMIGAAANILLDPLFIFVFNMGVKGAAWATVISQFISAVWVIRFLTGRKAALQIRAFRLNWQYLKKICALGVTGFTFKMTNSLTQAVVNITLRAFGGTSATLYIGSMSIINSLREFISLPVDGISQGTTPVMGFNYGARQWNRVRKCILFMVSCSLCYNILGWGALHLFPRTLAGIFTNDPALLETCIPCLHIYFGVYFLMTFQSCGQQTYISLNKPGYAVFFSMFRKVILILPLTLILPRAGLGAKGVFWAELCSQAIGATCCFTTMILKVYLPMRRKEQGEVANAA